MSSAEIAAVRERLTVVAERIHRASEAAGRGPSSVRLLVASKTQPAERVRTLLEVARSLELPVLLGENRVQELVEKGPALADLAPEWHLVGPLQSNKINHALRWADGIESVSSLELAQKIARRLAGRDKDLDLYVQVNVSGEPTKSGVAPEEAVDLALAIARLEGSRLRGFMTIGAHTSDLSVVREGFARLREIRDEVLASGAPGTEHARELSMGMSGDLEAAIAEGATIVRVGTALFGPRA